MDPQKAAKQWAIAQAVVEAGPEAALLYADESRIALLPLIRAMWHQRGQQVRIPTPGTNVSRALFGALNIRTGRWVYQVHEHMYKEDFIAFLEHLLTVYATGVIVLVVDNYSSHRAGVVHAWVAEHPRLRLLYLPTYCSHLVKPGTPRRNRREPAPNPLTSANSPKPTPPWAWSTSATPMKPNWHSRSRTPTIPTCSRSSIFCLNSSLPSSRAGPSGRDLTSPPS